MNAQATDPICIVCGAVLGVPEGARIVCPGCGRASRVMLGIADLRHPSRVDTLELTAVDRALLGAFDGATYEQLVELYFERLTPAGPSFQRQLEIHRQYKLKQAERGRQFVHMFLSAGQQRFGPRGKATALEIGCGAGAGLLALAEKFDTVVGVDPHLPSLILAQKAIAESGVRNVQVFQGYAQNVPFQTDIFDFVMAQNTLEHVFEVEAAVGEIHRVLAPRGVFVADSRNRFDLFFLEPHTGLRWVGMLPRSWAKKYVLWRTGVEYNHTLLQSYFNLRHALDCYWGRQDYTIGYPDIKAYGYPPRFGSMLSVIERVPALSQSLLLFFPSHLVVACKSELNGRAS